VLLGRSKELGALERWLRGGRPVVVVGEAGIGKTALLRAAAAATGRPVFAGGALATQAWQPYLPLVRALGRRPRGADAAAVAADVVATIGGSVLVVDDLHWADVETLELLPLLTSGVSLLASIRREDRGAVAAFAATAASDFERLELKGLGDAAARALVQGRRPEFDDEAVLRVVRDAGGNPLLLEELAATNQPSETLRHSIEARLQRASPSARRTLAVLGLLGRPAEPALLGSGAGELVELGLAVKLDGRIQVRHALLAEAAASELEPRERRQLHRLLADASPEPGEAAEHFLLAGQKIRAYKSARTAIECSTTPGERASHLAIAAECAPPQRAVDLRLEAATALASIHAWREVDELLTSIEPATPDQHAWTALLRGRAHLAAGGNAEAERELERGLDCCRGSGSRVEVALLIELVMIPLWSWDGPEALRRAKEAWKKSRATGFEGATARLALSRAHYVAGSLDLALRHARLARSAARASGEATIEFETAEVFAELLRMSSPRAVPDFIRSVIERTRQLSMRGWELQFRWHLARNYLFAGEAKRAVAELELVAGAPELGPARAEAAADLSLALAELGRDADARTAVAAALARPLTPFSAGRLHYAQAVVEWAAGRHDQALEAIGEARRPTKSGQLAMCCTVLEARIFVEQGRTPPIRATNRWGKVATRAGRADFRGLHELAAGEYKRAEASFDAAAELWRTEDPWAFAELLCLLGAAEAALRGGNLKSARERLLAIEARAEKHGLEPIVRRTRKSLRAAGVRVPAGRRTTRSRLSQREREVLELVAKGRSTAEISRALGLQPTTVDTHADSIMQKLGARTRLQACALLQQAERGQTVIEGPPLVVAEHGDITSAEHELSHQGWRVRWSWNLPGEAWAIARLRLVCAGRVSSTDEAATAILAAARGAGLLVSIDPSLANRAAFLDDLHRLGHVRFHSKISPSPTLTLEQRRLSELLADGFSLGEAADTLGLSRRTAARRMAAARDALGVPTTAEVVLRRDNM
jgi:DNA-binding NarL/FixJ family response regulator